MVKGVDTLILLLILPNNDYSVGKTNTEEKCMYNITNATPKSGSEFHCPIFQFKYLGTGKDSANTIFRTRLLSDT